MKGNSIHRLLREDDRRYRALCNEFIRLLGKLPNDFVLFDKDTRIIKTLNNGFEFKEEARQCATQIGTIDIRIVQAYSALVTKNDPSPSYGLPKFTLELSERAPSGGCSESSPFYHALRSLYDQIHYKERQKG